MGAFAMGYCIAARAMWGIAGCAAEVELLLLFFLLYAGRLLDATGG